MEWQTVDVGNATLNISVEGRGPALLVVGSSTYYSRTFSRQIKSACTLMCADLPHFVSLRPEFNVDSISFDLYARCVESMRAAAGRDQVVILGHSHHGNVALEYARRYPDRVSHVVLIASPPVDIEKTVVGGEAYWANHASEERKALLRSRRSALSREHLASLNPRDAYIARYVADAPLYWYDPSYDASWLWRDMKFEMGAVLAFRDLYREYELNWSARLLEIPVLAIMGLEDYVVPHVLWEGLLPGLDNVTFRVLEESGHTPQLEEPEAFDQLVLDWLQNNGMHIQ